MTAVSSDGWSSAIDRHCATWYNLSVMPWYLVLFHNTVMSAVIASISISHTFAHISFVFHIVANTYVYNRAHMKLTIKNLQYGDFGNYRCISKNSLGETEGSIRVYGKWELFNQIKCEKRCSPFLSFFFTLFCLSHKRSNRRSRLWFGGLDSETNNSVVPLHHQRSPWMHPFEMLAVLYWQSTI